MKNLQQISHQTAPAAHCAPDQQVLSAPYTVPQSGTMHDIQCQASRQQPTCCKDCSTAKKTQIFLSFLKRFPHPGQPLSRSI